MNVLIKATYLTLSQNVVQITPENFKLLKQWKVFLVFEVFQSNFPKSKFFLAKHKLTDVIRRFSDKNNLT